MYLHQCLLIQTDLETFNMEDPRGIDMKFWIDTILGFDFMMI